MAYKHGIYGGYEPSNEQIITTSNTIPVYIGSAPVHRLIEKIENINKPILVSNIEEAQTKLGFSTEDDFEKYTLSSAIFAHFKNKVKNLGPIIVINVLDPLDHASESTTSKEFTIINNKVELDENVIASTIVIANKTVLTDYIVESNLTTGKLIVTFLKNKDKSVSITYNTINPSIKNADIIGSFDLNSGVRKGISSIHNIYEELNIAPNILCVPYHGKDLDIRNKLLETCKSISGLWDAIIHTDLDPSIENTLDIIDKKVEDGFTSINEKLCWPMGKMQGRKIPMSVLAVVRTQQTDVKNKGVPCETPSNKELDITGLISSNNKPIKMNIETANLLNSKGITTGLFYGGKWVLWGPHMSNYEYEKTNKPEEIFDVNRRMDIYLNNDFKKRNAHLIDSPLTRNDIDSIINNEQIRLNSLVTEGKLLFAGIEFRSQNNIASDIMEGNFIFNTLVTATLPAKALTQKVQYTSSGIKTLLGLGSEKDEDR